MENEKLINYYTAATDQDALSIKKVKEIINQIPDEYLDNEMVIVAQMGQELRGIPISNLILDVEGKQLAIFNFILRNKLRQDALNTINSSDTSTENNNTDGQPENTNS